MSEQAALPQGFRYAGVACGIKRSGKPDISLIVADSPVTAAGVYTQNQVVAAPVLLSKARTPSRTIRAVITNSGNANACTGKQGMIDAIEMCEQVATKVGCEANDVLVMSTGVIGHSLPMPKLSAGIEQAFSSLNDDQNAFHSAADAICTTDKSRKTVFREVACGDKSYRIAAMAKGAGMIAPNMATMLAAVLTDAPLDAEMAQRMIATAADRSFNRVSVDGHTSTNDTLLLLASGEGEPLSGTALDTFTAALDDACIELAKQLVADGEGATHVMAIYLSGAESDADAKTIAETIAASPLVKTAITGGDPNWGRIVSAAGYAAAKICVDQTTLKVCGVTIYENGNPIEFDAARLSKTMKTSAEVKIELRVGQGSGQAEYWSSDLTTDYVRFNSEYTT